MWNVSSNWLVFFAMALFVQMALWHSESSSAVTLLLDADWMMLTNTSNQGEANSVTAPLAHEIQAADDGRFESCISRTWILNGYWNWMPREEVSTFQLIWCSIWKPGDSISGWSEVTSVWSEVTFVWSKVSSIIEWTGFLLSCPPTIQQ